MLPVNDLARLEEAPSQYVVVGSGKTATDACIWLLARGVDPDAICWVRPREPWMLNRALIQPDPAIFLGMAADTMEAAAPRGLARRPVPPAGGRRRHAAHRPLGHPDDGQGARRWPRGSSTSCARIENVVRRGHIRSVEPRPAHLRRRSGRDRDDALVVHCAADGLKYPPLVPVWRREAITLQPIRAGFPCFGAALVGYVEATRNDDAEKNRLCPPVQLRQLAAAVGADEPPRHPRHHVLLRRARHQGLGRWCRVEPGQGPAGYPPSAALDDARERLAAHTPTGVGAARRADVSQPWAPALMR